MKSVYIAGPEVFLQNAVKVLQLKKDLCSQAGFIGVTPFDSNLDGFSNEHAHGLKIAWANEKLIDSCDIVIANITPWHGLHADVGTCLEIGYARAKGKRIYAYSHTDTKLQIERLRRYFLSVTQDEQGFQRESYEGTLLEDFGMVDNLMIEGSVLGSGGEVVVIEMPHLTNVQKFCTFEGFQTCLQKAL